MFAKTLKRRASVSFEEQGPSKRLDVNYGEHHSDNPQSIDIIPVSGLAFHSLVSII